MININRKTSILSVFVIVALIGMFFNIEIAAASRISFAKNHYSFDLPSNWIEIPYSHVVEAQQVVVGQSEGQNNLSGIVFDGGFQKNQDAEYYFTYPYLLTRTIEGSQLSRKELRELIGSAGDYQEIAGKYFPNIEVIEESNLSRSFYSEEENRGYSTAVLNYPGIGDVVMLMVIIPGHEGVVLLQFYCLKDDYPQEIADFEYMANSFSFDAGYEYQGQVNSDRAEEMGKRVAKTTSFTIIILVILGIRAIYNKIFKK